MGGKRRLRGGRPRLLSRHDGLEGRIYARAYAAYEAEYGPFTSAMARLEAGRLAVAWCNVVATTSALDEARRQRRLGRGRKPNQVRIERLSKRQALSDKSYTEALDRFRTFVGANGHPLDLVRAIQQQQGTGTP